MARSGRRGVVVEAEDEPTLTPEYVPPQSLRFGFCLAVSLPVGSFSRFVFVSGFRLLFCFGLPAFGFRSLLQIKFWAFWPGKFVYQQSTETVTFLAYVKRP